LIATLIPIFQDYGGGTIDRIHIPSGRTGYIICLANCPILWKSKLQTEIVLSTMEMAYVALSTSCRDLFPLIDVTKKICSVFSLDKHVFHEHARLHIKRHEDNIGALSLGKMEPWRMTPRSKHYTIKYHWFREQNGSHQIKLVKIATDEQLGDLFTKGLTNVKFSNVDIGLVEKPFQHACL
jgi:hypothetical protein